MPARSKKQRRMMAIAEHHPSELYSKDKGAASMSHEQLHEFASTKEAKLPEHRSKKHHERSEKVRKAHES